MPVTIGFIQIAIWFCVGFFTACGWALGSWVVGRLLSRF